MGLCGLSACETGFADCDMDSSTGCEVNTQSVAEHCGVCGMRCVTPGGVPACMASRCELAACFTGRADCNATPTDGCEVDLAVDARNCGSCGMDCSLPNATGVCAAGGCAIGTCNAGFADCDGVAANGCETTLATSAAHCGMCGNLCTFPGSSAACSDGQCRIAACSAGFGDCDNNASNGCEAPFASDSLNCGGCGARCTVPSATAACVGGRCAVGTCNVGFADCDGNPANGCEVNTRSDPANCNGCGVRCTTPGATAACATGRCEIAVCDAGRTDCDGSYINGCEVSTLTNPMHCGGCGSWCSLSNATASCAGGRCAIESCNAGFANCDGNPANGCEVSIVSDGSNCGGCGVRCSPTNGTGVCAGGRCTVVACNAGFGDCNGSGADGCEVTLSGDVSNCGGCGARCSLSNAASFCSGGRCAVAGCNGGFANCNGNPADGCEVSTGDDRSNCGSCGRACALPNAAGTGCSGGSCVVTACVGGYGDCNGAAGDGCESNLNSDPSNCGGCGSRPREYCDLQDNNCDGACDNGGGCRVPVARSFQPTTGEHFYTVNPGEESCCGFRVEGSPYYFLYNTSAPGLSVFYRCRLTRPNGKHFYTTSGSCEGAAAVNEGVMGFIGSSPTCGAIPLYRSYNPTSDDHLYTTNASEFSGSLGAGYRSEGICGYVWTSGG